MSLEVIERHINATPMSQLIDLKSHQWKINRIRVVKINFGPLLETDMRQVFVIVVLNDHDDVFPANLVANHFSDSRLAGTCTTGDSDYKTVVQAGLQMNQNSNYFGAFQSSPRR
jgi:hypothetical protein